MPQLANILKSRLDYRYVLIVFLLFLTYWSSSQAIFTGQEWTSAVANTLHFILIMIAFVCVVAVDIRFRHQERASPSIKENLKTFLSTFVLGASWFFIFIAFGNPNLDLFTLALMALYFWKGACIEELLFRYAFPRFLVFEQYRYWVAQFISNGIFSFAHFFVWEFNLLASIIGFLFGIAQMIAFTYGQSFMAVVWGHTLYNLALIGCSWWFMVLITVIIISGVALKQMVSKK